MGQPSGGPGVGAVLAAFTGPPAGGWCSVLGKPSGSVLTADDVSAIVGYVLNYMIKHGYGDPTGTFPNPLDSAIFAQVSTTLRGGLAPLIGVATCDSLPANLENVPSVKAATPPSDVGQIFNVLLDWTGLGNIVFRGAVLIGIVALLLIAIRRLI